MLRSCLQKHRNVLQFQNSLSNSHLRSFGFKGLLSLLKPTTPSVAMSKDHRLIWIDMEMTGLDPVSDHILEVACIITEGNLQIVAEHTPLVIHQSDEILASMNEWCVKHHGQSGLTEACRKSHTSLQQAEDQLLTFLRVHTPSGKCPLAGNSVYMDRLFLSRYMPRLDRHIHYRIVDVSTIKELCRRWAPHAFRNAPKKKLQHRALFDIKESIEELKYYRKFMFSD
ncbi:Probable oligoribonuclease [Gryllus bimaculatus]|nr:Probable oligoribonuclease [Gryllus bimaculatus]